MVRSTLSLADTRVPAVLIGRATTTKLAAQMDDKLTHVVISGSPKMVLEQLDQLDFDRKVVCKLGFDELGIAIVVDTRQLEPNGSVLTITDLGNGMPAGYTTANAIARKGQLVLLEMPKGQADDTVISLTCDTIDGLTDEDEVLGSTHGADKISLYGVDGEFDLTVISLESGNYQTLPAFTAYEGELGADQDANFQAKYAWGNGNLVAAAVDSDGNLTIAGMTCEDMVAYAERETDVAFTKIGAVQLNSGDQVIGLGHAKGTYTATVLDRDGQLRFVGFKVDWSATDDKVSQMEDDLAVNVDDVLGGTTLAFKGWSHVDGALLFVDPTTGTKCLLKAENIPGWSNYLDQLGVIAMGEAAPIS
ncbi:MAG: hypothetical protein COW24_02165 [Candidatus Kerfeldbacteria bacterium CG15_BIG_FIL_POST_REV_8_21_14_020_45_12]|uniref:Uncharacterized protein n=1 Tax=Candidatus Kerfeldbacteria bacterium CG15_BIG_FIL_POST_REV_8_21_14_020_45_12 TaxID=2014247 RepID=A0A2M7H4A4_9BACT|nr:MAG: hypothetical protein COW24_02165 [Candidatus Kerfeldbacteria bacterium CG15_BIG_FIL_POST_REV_8_21_14_020_45_12]PJA94048.1 MAG: hypothetical protein CO132_00240 [Candidatus Kerfeldbacteria bacterium CG_4_9_14_3_um_filter_45_8]